MSNISSHIKGRALEKAVETIERRILYSQPGLKEANIIIKPRKVVIVNGVKHEIDIFITIDHGKGYNLTTIFECKNRKEEVDKNDIVIFEEKIEVTQAQKGYFVARKYSSGAIARAKQNNRIELIEADEEISSALPEITKVHYSLNDISSHNIALRSDKLPHKESVILLQGKKISSEDLLKIVTNTAIQLAAPDEVINSLPEGKYPYETTRRFTFRENKLVIDGNMHNDLIADVKWTMYIARPNIIAKFNIKTRGRVIIIEAVEFPNGDKIGESTLSHLD